MAANFGGNQMMMQPQNAAANPLQQFLLSQIQVNAGPVTGWQANVNVRERLNHVWQMVSQLRLVNNGQHETRDICTMTLQFEKGTFDNAPDKETYNKVIREKMDTLTQARTQIGVNTHAQLHAQAQAQRQAQPHQMNMANPGQLQGQLQRTGMGQQPQQPFHHLQHQMQASPIPASQQPLQVPMGMVNNGLPPHMANQQQQFQMNMQQQQQQQQQHPMPPEKRQQPSSNTFTAQDQLAVSNLVQNILGRMPEEDKQNKRNMIRAHMDPATLAKCREQNMDPLAVHVRNQSIQMIRQKKMQNLNEMQLQQSRNRAPSSVPMQQQRSGNPPAINGQGPQQPPMGVNQEYGSFAGNMGDMLGQQQAAGVLAQDAGQMVVPVSMPQGNPASQGLQGPPMGANGQRPLSNPNARPQPTQQAFNPQQAPSQAQLRASASAKAQQMALQGQPGGMGPMPPTQSPAMTTLNAPLRTPQQTQAANPVDPLQSSQPNIAQFGAPLDPRFAQGNQARGGQGGAMDGMALNGSMFPPHMPQETRQRFMALPKDQLSETLRRWNATNQGPAGKPHAGMLMNVQGARPNQLANPAGQFNRQGNPNQFMNVNPNGQQQHSMMANLNAQQQQQQHQLLMKQRMAQMPPQQRRGPNGQPGISMQEQQANQFEQFEFPQNIRSHLRGIPPNVTRWGELKQWASQTSHAALETVKRTQQLHFATHIRERGIQQQQRQQHAGGLMNGAGPPVAPGMAPVAPMVQQPPMAVDLGPVGFSTEDIERVRAYNSGKWTTASDDEIKQQMVKSHHTEQQRKIQEQRQMEVAHMAQSQPPPPPSQAAAQRTPQPAPPRQPNPHPASKAGGRSQPGVPPPGAQQQHPSAGSDVTTPNPPSARAPRAAQPTKSNPPPVPQPPKNNLKRASSDDLAEVQQPHVQKPPRPAVQQTGNQARSVPPGRGPPGADPAASWASAGAARHPAQPQNLQQASRLPVADMQKYFAIVQEETSRSVPLPVIQMAPEVKQATQQKLKAVAPKVRQAKMALPKWYAISKNEDKLRKFLRAYHMMALQFQDENLTKPLKDQLSINHAQIDQVILLMGSLLTDLTNKFPALSKSGNGVAGAGPAPNVNQLGPNATPAVPLNAANLQQQQQALEQSSHVKAPSRSNSRNNAPPAPTSAHPPSFPAEGFAKHLTADQLRLPKSKKAKFNASTSLGQQSQGPTAAQPAKQSSPEVKPQQPPQPAEPKKTVFYCPEPHCDHHFLDDFPDAEALERHREEEHVRPVQDPKKYALDHLALITGVDQDGAQKASRSLALLGSAPGSKAENTPAGTPMNRQVSVNGVQASPANSRASKTPKADEPTAARSTNADQDLIDLTSVFDDDLWGGSAVNPQELLHNFQLMETGAGGAISDMSVYRSITPNDTPESSKDGLSEPTSDISEGQELSINLDFVDMNQDWKPFGLSDMDNLLDLDAMNVNRDDEMTGVLEGDAPQFVPWHEFVDPAAFDKPFTFDQNFFSLNMD